MYKLTRKSLVPCRSRCSRGFVHGLPAVGLVLSTLLVADSALMIGGALEGPGYSCLSAQERVGRQEEERLFLEARRAVNQEEFERAADLFATLRNVHASTRFDADSYYWEAFARFRLGDLPEALLLLETLTAGYDLAREDQYGNKGRLFDEVQDLRLRIRRQQAESGDPDATTEVLRESRAVLQRERADSAQQAYAAAVAAQRARADSVQRGYVAAVAAQRARADSAQRAYAAAAAAQRERSDSAQRVYAAAVAAQRARADSAQRASAAAVAAQRARADTARRAAVSAQVQSASAQWAAATALANRLQTGVVSSRRASFQLTRVESGLLYNSFRPREGCENESVQQSALTALLRLETDRMGDVRSALERTDECSVNLRRQAVNWLARQDTEEAEQELIKVATSTPDSEVQKAAIMGLRRFVTIGSLRTLSEFARQSDDEGLRSAAVVALGRNRHEGAGEVLWQLFRDLNQQEGFRAEVFTALGRRTDVSTESLVTSYGTVGSEDLKIRLLRTLGRRAGTGEEDVTNWLFDRALSQPESIKVRQAAINAWALGPTIDLVRVSESYESLEPDLKERVFFALYRQALSTSDRVKAALAVDKMIELARLETDPEVRQRAVAWLGNTESERAVEFLRELLQSARPDTVPKPRRPVRRR